MGTTQNKASQDLFDQRRSNQEYMSSQATRETKVQTQHPYNTRTLFDSHVNFALYGSLSMTFQGTMLMLHPKDLRGKVEMVFQATLEEPNSFLKRESASVMLKKDERCLQKPCSKLKISMVSEDMIF